MEKEEHKSRPYEADDKLTSMCRLVYSKDHKTMYAVSKVEIVSDGVYFTIEGQNYTAQELYDTFDEYYEPFDEKPYYLPAGQSIESSNSYNNDIEKANEEVNRVCPICKSTNIDTSEDPHKLVFFSGDSNPGNLYIRCQDCGLTYFDGTNVSSGTKEKFNLFRSLVTKWNQLKVQ